jgi:hypothetical protein
MRLESSKLAPQPCRKLLPNIRCTLIAIRLAHEAISNVICKIYRALIVRCEFALYVVLHQRPLGPDVSPWIGENLERYLAELGLREFFLCHVRSFVEESCLGSRESSEKCLDETSQAHGES